MKEYDTYLESQYLKKNREFLTPDNKPLRKAYEAAVKSYGIEYGKFLPPNKNARILDVGCGIGLFLYFLKAKGYSNFFGIDISRQQVEFCRNNITDCVELVDAFDFLARENKPYQAIVMTDLLEHIPKDRSIKFLSLACNALDQGGTLIIRVPNMSNPFTLKERYGDITHEVGFNEDSLYAILNAVGFDNIAIYPVHYPILSVKHLVAGIAQRIFHMLLRVLFRIQGQSSPKVLTKNILAVARK